MGVVNNQGDTFYPSLGELKCYSPLVKSISKEQITYECYFSKLPEETKILGTNRANYPIFAEVPIGNGKLVILPRFKDMTKVTNILVKEIIPQIIHEEEPIFVPMWLSEFSTEFEKKANNMVSDIGKTKKLLYTKGKLLEKAVAFAFEKMGFSVEKPPNGTNPDIEIHTDKKKAICEVKGHTNRQSNRKDMYQLLAYSEEDGKAEKGILVSNSEYCKPPQHRKKGAFTDGAIRLGNNAEFSLLNSVELFEVTMLILQGKITETEKRALRNKIINGVGLVHINESFKQ